LLSKTTINNISGWNKYTTNNQTIIDIYKLEWTERDRLQIKFTISINNDLTYIVKYHNKVVKCDTVSGPQFLSSSTIFSIIVLEKLLATIDTSVPCIGNSDKAFMSIPKIMQSNGVITDKSGQEVATIKSLTTTGCHSTFHHQCHILVQPLQEPTGALRCAPCKRYRVSLQAMLARARKFTKSDSTHPSSHTNYYHLTEEHKVILLHCIHMKLQNFKQKSSLMQKLWKEVDVAGVTVDEQLTQIALSSVCFGNNS
jgi:hypothetical protein